ncbi:MAG: hypothetical protein FWG88_05190 [Oscillospiraceae bacterium]|nr:hypothetical protein [Oscillospiraceae bacterium]
MSDTKTAIHDYLCELRDADKSYIPGPNEVGRKYQMLFNGKTRNIVYSHEIYYSMKNRLDFDCEYSDFYELAKICCDELGMVYDDTTQHYNVLDLSFASFEITLH